MENKETTDKIPTMSLEDKFKVAINAVTKDLIEQLTPENFNKLASYCVEIAKADLHHHLTKQAEVIAEKFAIKYNKQYILQASEEYKQTIK